MKMSSITYMVKIDQLTTSQNHHGNYRNPERAFEALRCIGKEMNQVVQAEYVCDLFKDKEPFTNIGTI